MACGNNPDKQNLGLAPGDRCLNIASRNYEDDLRSEERIKELLTRLEMQKIDIARIQETHNATLEIFENRTYCIQFSKAIPGYKKRKKEMKRRKSDMEKEYGE